MTKYNPPAKAMTNPADTKNWARSPLVREVMNLEVNGNMLSVGYVEIYLPKDMVSPKDLQSMKNNARSILMDVARSVRR